ncbi:MAG: thioredoxin family protein [Acidobacteriaceae bacterium]
MARTLSNMVELGSTAPDFELPDVVSGKLVTLKDFSKAKGLLVMFICKHCPYVKHVEQELARIGKDYAGAGLGIVAISSNDAVAYPEDAPEGMLEQAQRVGFVFPYLYDETQEVARAYNAACTPDFFLFDGQQKLVYRGQLDDSRPRRGDSGNDIPVTGKDLRAAIDAVLAGRAVPIEQRPGLGCNIKWKE